MLRERDGIRRMISFHCVTARKHTRKSLNALLHSIFEGFASHFDRTISKVDRFTIETSCKRWQKKNQSLKLRVSSIIAKPGRRLIMMDYRVIGRVHCSANGTWKGEINGWNIYISFLSFCPGWCSITCYFRSFTFFLNLRLPQFQIYFIEFSRYHSRSRQRADLWAHIYCSRFASQNAIDFESLFSTKKAEVKNYYYWAWH